MADQPARRSAPPRERPSRERQPPPSQRTPGWRVTPAPDGRGAQSSGRPPMPSRSRWWIAAVVVGLLALNLWISSRALQPNAPIRIPYSPTFLSQVQAGNVKTIASTGDAIQGNLKNAIRYPPGAQGVSPS